MACWNSQQEGGWVYPTVVICIYGFFSTMRPAEPFLTPFLTGPYKNLTIEQVTTHVYPIWTYANLFLLIPAFLVTDYLRYKPVVILQGVAYMVAWLLLLFGSGMMATQSALFIYSVASASDIGYFSYIYSVVHSDHYQKVTSYCRASTLVGYSVGSLLGQLLVSVGSVSLFSLNIITLIFQSIGLLSSFLLPMPRRKFNEATQHSNGPKISGVSNSSISTQQALSIVEITKKRKLVSTALKLVTDYKECYSSTTVLFLSLWWAMGRCGFYQTANYVQVLWYSKQPTGNFTAYNGAVDAFATLSGAVASFAVGHMKLNWFAWGELILGLFSAVSAGSLYLMDLTSSIWICYACYVVFKSSYMLLITMCTFQIAMKLSRERYALMFGTNTFMATLLQTILTAIVINTNSLHLTIINQYFIYATYFATIALIFLIRGARTFLRTKCKLLEHISGETSSERSTHLPCDTD